MAPNTPSNPTFDKIMTSEILFYDGSFKTECKMFCERRHITYLPSRKDSRLCYRLVRGKFEEEKIEESQRVTVKDSIFDSSVLKKFEKHQVLFVYARNKIVGVVHFCDYNRNPVFLSVYPVLLEFERKLRELLISYGLTNGDMIGFFKEHSKNSIFYSEKAKYYRKAKIQVEMNELEPFQAFDLKDLIALAGSKNISKISESIVNLRNTIMHAKNIVKYEMSGLVYDSKSFKDFFESVESLRLELKRISSAIRPLTEKEEVVKLRKAGLFLRVNYGSRFSIEHSAFVV